jgi:hypothetical protein
MAQEIKGADWLVQLEGATLTTAPASDAEALAKTADDVAVTPANLAAIGSSATFAGLVELATDAEAQAVTDTARAVTAHGLGAALADLELIAFVGKNNVGACTATGLKVNDVIFSVTGVVAADVGDQSAKFEAVVSVADQIQQTDSGNLSTKVYLAFVKRMS